MKTLTEWLVEQGLADNGISAGHIVTGLKLEGLDRDEQEARCRLYRKWRPKTDKKNDIPSWQAFDLAIAGIDPDDVQPRQIDFVVAGEAEAQKLVEAVKKEVEAK